MRRTAGCLAAVALAACLAISGCAQKSETIMLPGNVPLEMVLVPAGSFVMGSPDTEQDREVSEGPQHKVKVDSFWMGKYELTKRQWTAVMGTPPPWVGQFYVLDSPESPAVYVSWDDARDFVAALNVLTGKTFELPGEAQWEYACRAGTTTRFYWGDDPGGTVINDYAWWDGNALSAGQKYAHISGQKLPDALGLYDMSGNVWEWCEDDWHADYVGAPTGDLPWVDSPRSDKRVVRGGSWNNPPLGCRSASRGYFYPPGFAFNLIGFRVARTP